MAPGLAIVGSSVDGPWCMISPVFSIGDIGGGVSPKLFVRDVGKAVGGNAVLDSSPFVWLRSQSPVLWRVGVGVGGCVCLAAADAQFLVGDAVAAPE